MKNEKNQWYYNLTASEITSELSRLAHNAVAYAKQGNDKESEKFKGIFNEKFKAVIPAISNIKTEFYMYRNDNNVYEEWNKCHQDIWYIKRGMENNLYLIYKDKE